MTQKILIGKLAMLVASLTPEELEPFSHQLKDVDYCEGKSGSMSMQKVISAVETSAKRNKIISEELYRETHALYHAISDRRRRYDADRGLTFRYCTWLTL
jgi:hut operon positive regulatory protein